MMGTIEAIIWGVVQGLTEFVPVSSSGHLVVVPRLLGIEAPGLIVNIALHAGTLAAVIIFFWKDLIALFLTERRRGLYVLLASAPVIVLGLLCIDYIAPLFTNPRLVGWIFFINSGILLIGHWRLRSGASGRSKEPNVRHAITIGLAQALALFPGISRSGSTICTGVLTGLDKDEAYRFSFLLFVPAGILALLYSIREASAADYAFSVNVAIGGIVSAIVGIFSLKLLYSIITRAKFHILAIYCALLGIITLSIFH